MHLLDLVLGVIIIGWTIAGGITGFTPQLITILSVILATLGSWILYPITAYKLEGIIQSPEVSIIVAPILLFIIIGLLSKILLKLLFKVITSEEKSEGNWIFGAGFGLLKGLILGGVIVYFLGQYGKPELVEDSISFKRYYHASEWVVETGQEYGIGDKIARGAEYMRENILPPANQRGESIETAATSVYNDKIAGYFETDFFNSASEFFSSAKDTEKAIND